MWRTLKFPDVWRPCVYMYLSIALSIDIHEGLFYWYTDSKGGPSFSEETVGFIFLDWCDRVSLWSITLSKCSEGSPISRHYFFIVIDESVSQMIGRLKWMPLLVLSAKLCPPGIEGTFFALLMSIDNAGLLSSQWGGGFVLHLLKVTRTRFDNLWLAILTRNILRVTPLGLLISSSER
ncbi:hypothetical protein OIU77_005380 [Salix suchowensis]|uniref:Uncharacterized protein n=1 Tax=Salix suchowensis TaxID=1278906 RepID=A0ABQ9AP92_9ROSI|nr:hypothetical protein OIU77_005380 [Salix suchowensis]